MGLLKQDAFDLYPKKVGWDVQHEQEKVKSVSSSCSIRISPKDMNDTYIEERLIRENLTNIITDLKNSKYIHNEFVKREEIGSYESEISCRTTLKVVEPQIDYIMNSFNVFKYKNIDWTLDEIKSAIDNTYPHRMI